MEEEGAEKFVNYFKIDIMVGLDKYGPFSIKKLVDYLGDHIEAPNISIFECVKNVIPYLINDGFVSYDSKKKLYSITEKGLAKLLKIDKQELPNVISEEIGGGLTIH